MNVRGCSLEEFRRIVDSVSDAFYHGNVIVDPQAHENGSSRTDGFVGRIRVENSSGDGARRTWTGRRQPAACWHAYRDVLDALFERYPDATVRTGLATYTGRGGFLDEFPATAWANVGSEFQPALMADLCECGSELRERSIG